MEVDTIPSDLHDGEVYLYNGAGSTSRGWRTAMSGDVGWPDLLLVRGDRIVAAELKSDRGMVTQDQANWLAALRAGGVETYVWRPADWHCGHVLTALQGHVEASASLIPRDWMAADDRRRAETMAAGTRRRAAFARARSTR